jgi:hypothetical protein
MDLLALSGGLVLAVAMRKAVKTWAARRQFRVALMVLLLHFWALLEAAAELNNATAGGMPACMLLLRGGGGRGHQEGKGGL